MFGRLAFRGVRASLLYREYFTAAELTAWTVVRESALAGGDGSWRLTATIARRDPFYIRQRGLLFVAPRPGAAGGGFWRWPIEEIQSTDKAVLARLGPPEG